MKNPSPLVGEGGARTPKAGGRVRGLAKTSQKAARAIYEGIRLTLNAAFGRLSAIGNVKV